MKSLFTIFAIIFLFFQSAIAAQNFYQNNGKGGYAIGLYDDGGAQPAAFNWSRNSKFNTYNFPDKKWEFITGDFVKSSPTVASDGSIVFGSEDGKVYSLSSNGDKIWEFQAGSTIDSSPAIAKDGTIYIGSNDKKLYALSSIGAKKWEFITGSAIKNSFAIGPDGTIYLSSDKLYAVGADGGIKWSYQAGGDFKTSPSVGKDGTIYAGSLDGKLYALNPNGTQKWSFTVGQFIDGAPAISDDGTIYVGAWDGKLYALMDGGVKRWSYTTGSAILAAPVIGANGTIYIGSGDKNLYALNPNGSLKWKFQTDTPIVTTPIISTDGYIFLGSGQNFYALNADGTQVGGFSINAPIESSAAIDSSGALYIGSNDKKLYKIGGKSVQQINLSGAISDLTGTFNIGWYFWMMPSGSAYLASGRDNAGGLAIYKYMPDRKWQPASNAQSFDGYAAAPAIFSTSTISNDGKSISFANSLNSVPSELLGTFNIGWYFWMTPSGNAYLASGRDLSQGVAIWQYTSERKWLPIHNASAFDGYPAAGKVFDSVTFSSDGRYISINKNASVPGSSSQSGTGSTTSVTTSTSSSVSSPQTSQITGYESLINITYQIGAAKNYKLELKSDSPLSIVRISGPSKTKIILLDQNLAQIDTNSDGDGGSYTRAKLVAGTYAVTITPSDTTAPYTFYVESPGIK